MLLYIVLSIGFLFSLIAVFRNREENYLNSFLVTMISYSLFFCIAKINDALQYINYETSTAPITILLVISLISLLIYQFRQTDITW
jgi:putative effector of murein hydrolase